MRSTSVQDYRGHTLRTTPPSDGIPMFTAKRKYGLSIETLWKLIDAGKLLAGFGKSSSGNRCVMVSRSGLNHHKAAATTSVPTDGVPVKVIAVELGVKDDTIRTWCEWEVHPALGRRVRSGNGPFDVKEHSGKVRKRNGLIVSRADVEAIVDLIRNPFNRPIPGNPGEWIADGIFRHQDGRLFFSERYVTDNRAKFGLSENALFNAAYIKHLEPLKVVWPGMRGATNGPWMLTVFSDVSLSRLIERRTGKVDGGEWLVAAEIWNDTEGLWFSSIHIGRQLKMTRAQVEDLRDGGKLTRFKPVTLGRKAGSDPTATKRPANIIVHHESEARPLLGIGGKPGTNGTASVRKRPEHEKHLKWKAWKDAGASYAQIVVRERDETGQQYTRDAVIQAIRRL